MRNELTESSPSDGGGGGKDLPCNVVNNDDHLDAVVSMTLTRESNTAYQIVEGENEQALVDGLQQENAFVEWPKWRLIRGSLESLPKLEVHTERDYGRTSKQALHLHLNRHSRLHTPTDDHPNDPVMSLTDGEKRAIGWGN